MSKISFRQQIDDILQGDLEEERIIKIISLFTELIEKERIGKKVGENKQIACYCNDSECSFCGYSWNKALDTLLSKLDQLK